MERNIYKIGKELFITSEEEIKEGGWLLIIDDFETYVREHKGDNLPTTYHKKIILTTDQNLIKDSVQSIGDEFLEWFVKNPSCEEVYVEEEDYSQKCRECGETVKRGYNCKKGCFMKSGNFIPTDKNIKYKIIMPKEEPLIEFTLIEKELIEEAKKLWQESHPNPIEMALFGTKWQQERSYSEKEVLELLHKRMIYTLGEEYKKETTLKWFEQFKKTQ